MPARRQYLLKAIVYADPLGIRQDHKSWVLGAVAARHKWNRPDESAYCLANELICAELGRFIGLPIPPYAITKSDDDEFSSREMFSSLDFNWDGRDLSPVEPEFCVTSLPDLCTGIVAFDVFVCNADRHDKNLAVDQTEAPKDIRVFDHDCALFGTHAGHGVKRLDEMVGRLGVSAGRVTRGNRHCLIDALKDNNCFRKWIDRIHGIPHDFITRVCSDAMQHGISQEEAGRAANFLNERKWSLRGILDRHHKEFKGIPKWPTL